VSSWRAAATSSCWSTPTQVNEAIDRFLQEGVDVVSEPADVDDTRAFGRALAAVLRAGDLVVLSGPLGAGKTALAQGIGAGLGVPATSRRRRS
jgi:MoxR-like ATPase